MKNIVYILLIFILAFATSCKKAEVLQPKDDVSLIKKGGEADIIEAEDDDNDSDDPEVDIVEEEDEDDDSDDPIIEIIETEDDDEDSSDPVVDNGRIGGGGFSSDDGNKGVIIRK